MIRFLALLFVITAVQPGFAEEVSATSTVETNGSLLDSGAHAFISQGYIKSFGSNYLADTRDGTFYFSEVGINYTKSLTNKIDVGAQVFARKLGSIGNYNANFDWFFVGYKWSDALRLKIGRIKIPFGLYNDSSDFDSARMAILLPQSIYSLSSRDFLLAHNGGQLHGYLDLGGMGGLNYHAFAGAINITIPAQASFTQLITRTSIPYLYGGRLLWDTPVEGLRAGVTYEKLKLDVDAITATPASTIMASIFADLAVFSLEYTWRKLTFTTEYNRIFTTTEVATSRSSYVDSERYYGMATYQLFDSLGVGGYYSKLVPDITKGGDHQFRQQDLALFLRYDLNPYWLVKLEGHAMDGTAGLSAAQNGGKPTSRMDNNWSVFLVKTTAYF